MSTGLRSPTAWWRSRLKYLLLAGLGILVCALCVDPVVRSEASARQPLLGSKDYAGPYGVGFGAIRPKKISNGGAAPSGSIYRVRWHRWGTSVAHGKGEIPIYRPNGGYYPRRGKIRLRASRLGFCGSSSWPAYRVLKVKVQRKPGGSFSRWLNWSRTGNICVYGFKTVDRHRFESSPTLLANPEPSSLRAIKPCVKTLYWGCRVRPRVLVVGARASITRLQWQRWGFDGATGIGMITNGASTGQPDSGFGPLPARIRYWGRVRCRWGSVFRFQRFSYDLKGATKVHKYRDRRPCSR